MLKILVVAALLWSAVAEGATTAKRVVMVTPAPIEAPAEQLAQRFSAQLAREGIDASGVTVSVVAAGPDPASAQKTVDEVIASKPDLITVTGRVQTQAVMERTRTIPVVFTNVDDPVRDGFVKSLREPGGNATGIAARISELHGKRLEIFKQLRPRATSVALLVPERIRGTAVVANLERALAELKLKAIEIAGPEKMDRAVLVAALQKSGADAFISVGFEQPADAWPEIQLASRVPGLFQHPDIARMGGLMAHGPNFAEMETRLVAMAAKVLRGQAPGNIPVEELARPYLVINLRSARALGIDVPPAVRLLADELVE
jgi:putative ABC transport system substrate-binding protein